MAKNKDTYRRMLAAAVGLVSVLACGCAGGEAAVDNGGELSSKEGQIAFVRTPSFEGTNIESDIYSINVDGTRERRLTDTPGLDAFPSWSPDGRSLAFASDRAGGGNWELYVMGSDGTHQRRLTHTPQEDEAAPAWSPDGEKIAYVTDIASEYPTIWVMNADGSARRRLASGNWPSWSPDGKRMAYTTYHNVGAQFRLAVMDADGSDQHGLADSLIRRLTVTADAEEPAWSPAGTRIAFSGKPIGGDAEIYVMNSDGSDRRRLTDIPGAAHWPPTWSADGERIAFTCEGTEGNPEIYVMNSDGSGLTRLPSDPAEDAFPAWRPSGGSSTHAR
jgi:TolB protein